MEIKINCKWNNKGAWCKCKEIKRSLWGFGARLCVEFNDEHCIWKVEHLSRPITPKGMKYVMSKNDQLPEFTNNLKTIWGRGGKS